MRDENGSSEGSVALYWDFENIHARLCEQQEPGAYSRPDNRFKVQEPLVNINAVVDLAASFGPIVINRAYCNWQFFYRYRDGLLQNAVELIQMFPPGGGAKNGADIKLCLDATEDISRFAHIRTVIIVGGDSDFMPVSQKIKAAGRYLVGVGNRKSTNKHWAKSCHEFRYYETLVEVADGVGAQVAAPGDAAAESPSLETVPKATDGEKAASIGLAGDGTSVRETGASPRELLTRAIRLLADKKGESWIAKAEVGPMIKRLDPTFDLAGNGYSSFSAMLKAFDAIVEVRKGENHHQVRLR
jgi:hypothetical protein